MRCPSCGSKRLAQKCGIRFALVKDNEFSCTRCGCEFIVKNQDKAKVGLLIPEQFEDIVRGVIKNAVKDFNKQRKHSKHKESAKRNIF